jgi:hypothetical protein
MKNTLIAIVLSTLTTLGATGCSGTTPQTAVNAGLTLTADICQLISQDDPSAPQWVQVACQTESQVAPVVVSLPWSTWQSMLGVKAATTAAARAAAMKAVVQKAKSH